jgi:hypothetical protein
VSFPKGAGASELRSTPAIFNRATNFLLLDRNTSAYRALCDMDRLFLSITAVSLIVLVTTISLDPVPVSEQLAASIAAFLH